MGPKTKVAWIFLVIIGFTFVPQTNALFGSVYNWFSGSEDTEEPVKTEEENEGPSWINIFASLKGAGGFGGGALSAILPVLSGNKDGSGTLLQSVLKAWQGEDASLGDVLDDLLPIIIKSLEKSDPANALILKKLVDHNENGSSALNTFLGELTSRGIVREDWMNVASEAFAIGPNGTSVAGFSMGKLLYLLVKGSDNKTIPISIFTPLAVTFLETTTSNVSTSPAYPMIQRLSGRDCQIEVGTLLKLLNPILSSNLTKGLIQHTLEVLAHPDSNVDTRCIVQAVIGTQNGSSDTLSLLISEFVEGDGSGNSLVSDLMSSMSSASGSNFSLMDWMNSKQSLFGSILSTLTGDESFDIASLLPLVQNILGDSAGSKSTILNIVMSILIGKERPVGVCESCWEQFLLMKKGFVNQEGWAVNMWDAWGKLRSGILHGQLTFLGNYDMCLGVKGRSEVVKGDVTSFVDVNGEYCRTTLEATYGAGQNKTGTSFEIQLGVCVPEVCDSSEIQIIVSRMLSMLASVNRVKCVQEEQMYILNDVGATIVVAFVGVFVLVVTITTCVDRVWCRRRRRRVKKRVANSDVPYLSISATPTEVTLTELNATEMNQFGSTSTCLTRNYDDKEYRCVDCGKPETSSSASSSSSASGGELDDDDDDGVLYFTTAPHRASSTDDDDDDEGDDDDEDGAALPFMGYREEKSAKFHLGSRDSDVVSNRSACSDVDTPAVVVAADPGRAKGVSAAVPVEKKEKLPQQSKRRQHHVLHDVLHAFSLTSNLKRLLSTKTHAGPAPCIHGLRVISLVWLVQYSMGDWAFYQILSENVGHLAVATQELPAQVFMSGTLGIDTLFFISGLVVSYMFTEQLNQAKGLAKKWKVYVRCCVVHVVHGIVKFTPLYLVTLLLFGYVLPYVGNGPLWFTDDHAMISNCRGKWWQNLLYISNLGSDGKKDMCMPWTWYLAADFQFYIFAPFIILLLGCLPALGATILFVLVFTSVGVIAGLYVGVYQPNPRYFSDDLVGGDFVKIYVKPWCRFAPYGVGILIGYILSKYEKRVRIKNKCVAVLGWFLCTVLALVLILTSYNRHCVGCTRWNLAGSATWEATRHFAWSLCMVWIVLACHGRYAGIVNNMLSWKAFIPLSRLVKSTYLVHPIIMYLIFMNRRQTIYFETNTQVIYTTGFVIVSFVVSALMNLVFEWPLLQLEHIVYRRVREHQIIKKGGRCESSENVREDA